MKDNITSLAWASAGGLCSIIYTTIVVIWEALSIEPVSAAVGVAAAAAAAEAGPGEHVITYRSEVEPLQSYVSFAGVLGTAGIIVFSFVVQMQVPTIFVEVRDPAQSPVSDAIPIVNASDEGEDDVRCLLLLLLLLAVCCCAQRAAAASGGDGDGGIASAGGGGNAAATSAWWCRVSTLHRAVHV